MARRKKNDPRSNHGKYSSGDAPKRFTNESKNSEATTTSTSGDTTDKNTSGKDEPTKMASDSSPKLPSGNARAAVNDPEWYAKDAQLVIDAASLPFSEPMGAELKLQHDGEIYTSDGTNPLVVADNNTKGSAVPGICTIVTKSSFGSNRYAQDPANVAMNALYSHVRYVNSGRKNYDAVDLFMYCASMADVYSYIMWCQRIYAKAFLYSQRNKYVGEALLKSEFIDKNDIEIKLANFRYWINTYINKISSYAVPADISYFQRRAWIYSHIYLENPDGNIKDQLYQFSPDGFYRFALDSSGAGMLDYKSLGDIIGHAVSDVTPITVNDIMAIGEWLIANVTGDEDFGLMSGDVLKAFNGNIIGVASMPEVVDIVPVYSEYVLLQMRNASVVPVSRSNYNPIHYDDTAGGVACYLGNMYQNSDGNLYSLEGIPMDSGLYNVTDFAINIGINKVLTVKTPTPSPIDVMEISRMTLGGYGFLKLTGYDGCVKVACGADIAVNILITQYGYDANGNWALNNFSMWNNLVFKTSIQNNSYTVNYLQYLRFKYAPLLYVANEVNSGTPTTINDVWVASDVDNYTIVDWRIIARLHEVALLSMLWVPGVAKMVNF